MSVEKLIVSVRVIRAREGTPLALSRVNAGFVAAAQVVKPRYLPVNGALAVFAFNECAFTDYGDIVKDACQRVVRTVRFVQICLAGK